MVLAKSLRILLGIELIFLVVGCSLVSGVPISEASTPTLSPQIPTTPPVQDTPTVEATYKPIIYQSPTGNSGGVEGLAFSPDGSSLASMYKNGEIILWDVATRQNIRSFMGGGETGGLGTMTGIAFSPDGKFLVSKVNGMTITLWDVATSQSIDVVRDLGYGNGMALNPDGKMLAYGQCAELDSGSRCTQYEIILWDVATHQPAGQPLRFNVAALAPLWLLFSPDGKTLAVMSSGTTGSGKIELFDVVTRQSIVSPTIGKAQFSSMAFSPDGKFMALAGIPGVIHIWDMESRQVASQLIGEKGLVTGVIFSPDGKTLASRILIPGANPREKIVLWEMDKLQTIGQPLTGQDVTGSEVGLISMAFSPDGRILAIGTDDGAIILWDLTASTHSP
jgi:WD40 repeat protein